MLKLDAYDHRILAALQNDCTEPIEALGQRIGLSRNACWRRIKMLEESGIIRGRVALCDPDALGVGLTVFVAVQTDRHDEHWHLQFARAVEGMPEVLGAYRTSGDTDYLLQARVADVRAYDRLYQRLIRRVPIKDLSASFVMEELKETTALPTGG